MPIKNLVYKSNTTIEPSYRQVGKQFCLYLGRHIVYVLIHAYKFLAKAPIPQTSAYCRLMEIKHRVDCAYMRVLNDIEEQDIKGNVTEIYKQLKTKIDELKTNLYQRKSLRLKAITDINKLSLIYKDEASIFHKMGVKLMHDYVENFEKDLKEIEEKLENAVLKHRENMTSLTSIPNMNQIVSAYQLCSLADDYKIKINELREETSDVTHPETAYQLQKTSQSIKYEVENNLSTLLNLTPLPIEEEQEKNALRAKALKVFLGPPEENKQPQADQLLTILADHLNRKGLQRANLRIEICDYMNTHKSNFCPEEKYEEFGLYLKKMSESKTVPGNLELQAVAKKESLKIRLYSHLFEPSYKDFGEKEGDPDLSLFLDEEGNISSLSK